MMALGICLLVACAYHGVVMVKGSSPAMASQEQDTARFSTVPITTNPLTKNCEMTSPP
jgi:hypothetical protein